MTWIVKDLNRRIDIKRAIQSSNSSGGFDRSYTTLVSVWAGIETVSYKSSGNKYIRNVQVNDIITHIFKIRRVGLTSIGKEYTKAYSIAFDSMSDLNLLKSNCFIFMKRYSSSKGRLFKIKDVINYKEDDNYYLVSVTEMEEHGTGFSE